MFRERKTKIFEIAVAFNKLSRENPIGADSGDFMSTIQNTLISTKFYWHISHLFDSVEMCLAAQMIYVDFNLLLISKIDDNTMEFGCKFGKFEW